VNELPESANLRPVDRNFSAVTITLPSHRRGAMADNECICFWGPTYKDLKIYLKIVVSSS